MKFKNDNEALIHGLILAVTADTDLKSNEALTLCEKVTESLSEFEVARCKKIAEGILDGGGTPSQMFDRLSSQMEKQ